MSPTLGAQPLLMNLIEGKAYVISAILLLLLRNCTLLAQSSDCTLNSHGCRAPLTS